MWQKYLSIHDYVIRDCIFTILKMYINVLSNIYSQHLDINIGQTHLDNVTTIDVPSAKQDTLIPRQYNSWVCRQATES